MKHLYYILCLLLLPVAVWAEEVKGTPDDGAGGIVRMALSDTQVALTCTPFTGYTFQQWLDGNTDNPRMVDISEVAAVGTTGLVYKAVFVNTSVTAMSEGTTTVTVPTPNVPTFALSVTPASSESQFYCWSNASKDNPLSYTETMGLVYPIFNGLASSHNDGKGGTIIFVVNGDNVELTPVPNTGYVFSQWMDGSTTVPRLIAKSAIGPNTSTAVFAYETALSSNNGDVTVTITDPAVPSFSLAYDNCSEFDAFSCWSNGQTNKTFAYSESMGAIAPRYRSVELTNDDKIGGTIDYVETDCGYTLTAVPNSGFKFVQWEDNSTSAVRTINPGDATYSATFEEVIGAYKVNGETYATAEDAMAAVVASQGQYPLVITDNTTDDITVATKMTINASGNSIGDLTILNGGDLTLSSAMTVNNLYLNATRGSSSQLRGESNLTYNDAYIDITLNAGASVANDKLWYAFAVPFNVDIETGIRRANAPATSCKSNTDYLIWEYDGQLRADSEDNGWKKALTGTLTPGKFYMMGINGNCNTWRLQKANGATLGGSASLSMSEYASSSKVDAGWNAMGNSTLTYATAAVVGGISIGQFYANGATTARYDVINFNESGFVMASPFFVQVAADDQLTLSPLTGSATMYAPTRRSAAPEYYKLQLMLDETQADVVYLTASEDAENEYVIGKDVMKMVGGNTNSYLWTNAYGYRLCAQDARIVDGVAEYSLSMYAPEMATYSLALSAMAEEATLWKQDKQVWDFANGAYPMMLPKGTTNGYTLRIGVSRGIGTNLIIPAGENQTDKFIYRNTLFIRANGELFNAQGARLSNTK